jgi:hypothetical protein
LIDPGAVFFRQALLDPSFAFRQSQPNSSQSFIYRVEKHTVLLQPWKALLGAKAIYRFRCLLNHDTAKAFWLVTHPLAASGWRLNIRSNAMPATI